MALSKLHLCGLGWEAWTDFGSVGVGRRAILTQSDRKRQGSAHPRVDPPTGYIDQDRKTTVNLNDLHDDYCT